MLIGLLQLNGYFGEGMGGAKARGIGGGDCHIILGEDWKEMGGLSSGVR